MDYWDNGFDDDFPDNYDKYMQDNSFSSFLDLPLDTNSDEPIFLPKKNIEDDKPKYGNEKSGQPPNCISDFIRQPNSEDQNFFKEIKNPNSCLTVQNGKKLQSNECISDSSSKGPPEKQEIPLITAKEEVPYYVNRIPQPRIGQLHNEINHHESQSLRKIEAPRYRIECSDGSNSFKQQFYSIFLNNIKGKNIFPKDKVIAIHNSICVQAGVRRMRRDEYRAINNYFKHFAKYKNQILRCIIDNKEELSSLIDLPSIIEKANSSVETRQKKSNCT